MTGRKIRNQVLASFIIIILTLFIARQPVLADEPQFILSIDDLSLQMGVSTNLVLTMANVQNAKVKSIDGLDDFDVLSSSQSTSTSIVNNKTSFKREINYIIMPKKAGQFTLQANVEYNGKTYQTNELKITVTEAKEDLSGEVSDLFIKTNISSNEVYFGQKVVLTYELYSRYNIENFGFLDNVNIDGFMMKDIDQKDLKASYVYIDDKKYVKYEARQIILSPLKTGTFTIPAYNFQANVSTGDFFRSSRPVYLQTESLELSVKPLPIDNRPLNFSGVVGELNLESRYSRTELNYGDSLTLSVTASGNCNLEVLDDIIRDGIPGFSVYETEKNLEESVVDDQYAARKEFEIILVPEANGEMKIDPITISYFNSESGSYEEVIIPGTTIAVKGDAPQSHSNSSGVFSQAETVKVDKISYNTDNTGYLTIQIKKEHLFIGLGVILVLMVLAASYFIIVKHAGKRDKKLQEIYNRLKKAEDLNEMYNLFNSMIKHCFNLSLKSSPKSVIENCLKDSGLSGPVLEIMDYVEDGKYHLEKNNTAFKRKIESVFKQLKKTKRVTE